MNILDLFAHIGLKADTGAANSFLKSVNGIKAGLIGAVTGTLTLAAAVKALNSSMADSNAMNKFAADTGASVEELQRWKAVADQVSGSGETVAASIRAITQNQEKIKLGQGNISGYQLLGIDPRSDPFKVLEALREKTQGMSQGMRRNIAAQFGVSNDLVQTLELTNDQFDLMAQKAWVVPKETIDRINKVRSGIAELSQRLNYMRMEAIAKLAPYIEKGIVWIGKIIDFGSRLVQIVDRIIRSTIGWKNAIAILAVSLGALVLTTSPLTFGLIALLLVLDDLYVYSQGGKSVFGEMVKQVPALGAAFDVAFGALKGIAAAIEAIYNNDFSKLDEITEKWGVFGDVLNAVAQALNIINQGLTVQGAKATVEGIKEKGFFAEYADQWKNFGNLVMGTDWTGNKRSESAGATNITVSPSIVINGATDPAATGAEVQRRMDDTYKNARTNLTGSKREK